MIRIGVIGYGYWGPNLVRNYMANPRTSVVAVSDFSAERLTQVQSLYPAIETTTDCGTLINNPAIDAVAIATPVASHYELAMAALQAGKHVFVEKPITSSAEEAKRLIEEADRRNLTLMVDHTFIYTGAIQKIHEVVREPSFGDLRYYDSTRVNLGIFQHDVNVLWDLAVHDLAILSHITLENPVAVSAVGHSHLPGQPANIAYLTLFFSNNLIAHVSVNWLSPVKVRRTLISGSNKMIVYDDLEASEKVKVYDNGITVAENADDIRKIKISYRTGDLWSPKVPSLEALQLEVDHFIDCIEQNRKPITSGEEGLTIVRILEAADQSMASQGAPVDLATI